MTALSRTAPRAERIHERSETMSDFSTALAALIAEEPGIWIEAKPNHQVPPRIEIMVGFRFDCATGRELAFGFGDTFDDALARAKDKRAAKLASAEVEAEVRREVAERMKAAA